MLFKNGGVRFRCGLEGTSSTANAVPLLPFRLNGRCASFASSLLQLPCGVTRHPKTVINRFEMAPPKGKVYYTAFGMVGDDILGVPPCEETCPNPCHPERSGVKRNAVEWV